MRENVRFFADIGVELLTYETYNYGFGFDDLRNYMMSLIFWDPYMPDEEYYAHMEEYMAAYYGDRLGEYLRIPVHLGAKHAEFPPLLRHAGRQHIEK